MTDLEEAMKVYEVHRLAKTYLDGGNKHAVFEALIAARITKVLVEFDGYSDSGQLEGPSFFSGEASVEPPTTNVTLQRLAFGAAEPQAVELTLLEAIDELCYGYLETRHSGWEINDGAYGEFTFDVARYNVRLVFHRRFTDVLSDGTNF